MPDLVCQFARASSVDAIPGEKTFGVSVIHVWVHVKHCERLSWRLTSRKVYALQRRWASAWVWRSNGS